MALFSANVRAIYEENLPGFFSQDMGDMVFGSFVDSGNRLKVYDEIADPRLARERIESCLAEYNSGARVTLNVAIFEGMFRHVCRAARVVFQNKGHGLFLGFKSSGRKSCAKLAARLCGFRVFELKNTVFYSKKEWERDLDHLMRSLRDNEEPTVVLATENQMKNEAFLEDVSFILSRVGDQSEMDKVVDGGQEEGSCGKSVVSHEGLFQQVSALRENASRQVYCLSLSTVTSCNTFQNVLFFL